MGGDNDLQPKMTMKLSNFLSKNTHLSRTHSAIKHHHENKQEQDDGDDDDYHIEKRKKKKKGWSFFLKNKLGSKISNVFGKISNRNRSSSSSSNKNNNGSNPHNHDDVKEKQGKPGTVGEILFNGTRSTTAGMNRSRSLKRGVVVVKKAKVKEMMVLERKQSMRRNNHMEEEEGEELCKKRILMGFRCKPIYDQNGVISID